MGYKEYHEVFMRNNHGSTAGHTFACILFTVQCAVYVAFKPRFPSFYQYIYEYLVIVLPMILAHTILADYVYALNILMSIILLKRLLSSYSITFEKFYKKNVFPSNRLPLISCLRGLTYLITGLCILAVDFQDFPRHLAKTERYGFSLMDTGVGLFVIVSGLVHKDFSKECAKDIIKGNYQIITILLVMGVGRFVLIKQLDYHEHVTEYGVHWNFFFTLAICKIISSIVLYFSNRTMLLCVVSLVIHEYVLYMGLQDWVFSYAPRDSIISANREGISSCIGYVSIYFFGVHIRNMLLNKNVTKYDTQIMFLLSTVVMWILTFLINFIRPTSRTLANAGYCIYIDTLLVTMTSILYFVVVLVEDKENNFRVPQIISDINTNGLPYFLIANLLTGAVNLSVRTLLVSSIVTFTILNVYMIVTIVLISLIKPNVN